MLKKLIIKTALLAGPEAKVLPDSQLELRPRAIHKQAAAYALGCKLELLVGPDDGNPFCWRGPAEVAEAPRRSLLEDTQANYTQHPALNLSLLTPRQRAMTAIQFRLGCPAYKLWQSTLECIDQSYRGGDERNLVVAALTQAHIESRQQLAVTIEKVLCLRDPREAPLLTTTQWAKAQKQGKAQPA